MKLTGYRAATIMQWLGTVTLLVLGISLMSATLTTPTRFTIQDTQHAFVMCIGTAILWAWAWSVVKQLIKRGQ